MNKNRLNNYWENVKSNKGKVIFMGAMLVVAVGGIHCVDGMISRDMERAQQERANKKAHVMEMQKHQNANMVDRLDSVQGVNLDHAQRIKQLENQIQQLKNVRTDRKPVSNDYPKIIIDGVVDPQSEMIKDDDFYINRYLQSPKWMEVQRNKRHVIDIMNATVFSETSKGLVRGVFKINPKDGGGCSFGALQFHNKYAGKDFIRGYGNRLGLPPMQCTQDYFDLWTQSARLNLHQMVVSHIDYFERVTLAKTKDVLSKCNLSITPETLAYASSLVIQRGKTGFYRACKKESQWVNVASVDTLKLFAIEVNSVPYQMKNALSKGWARGLYKRPQKTFKNVVKISSGGVK